MAPRLYHAALLLTLAAAATLLPGGAALSWPLCNNGGQVWVTERPHTEPTFPGANLWFFCDSGLNVLGVAVDPCIYNGTVCTNAVYDALCQGFGFDGAWTQANGGEAPPVRQASPDEAVRSLTGEYCLRKGQYAAAVPQDLASLPGEPCQKIDGITCIRNRQTIVTALRTAELEAFKPAPPAAEPVTPAVNEVPPAQPDGAAALAAPAAEQATAAPGAGSGGGRKLLSAHA